MISKEIARALQHVAAGLGSRRGEFVFVGGAITGMLVTDPAAPEPRPTKDVDVVIDVASNLEWFALSAFLRERGFAEDPNGPICRWDYCGQRVDVMPARDENPLGFSNRWYPAAIANAQDIDLEDGARIRVISAVHFVATKLEAFDGRGGADFVASHDLEDVVAVVDGRPSLIAEMAAAVDDAAAFVRLRLTDLTADDAFADAVAGHLPGDSASQARVPVVMERLRRIAEGRA
jgi:hypothetical protein